jgi:hypothetical protein
MPVTTQHAQYKKFATKWERCRDVSAGQDAVHTGGEKYLPKLKSQTPDDYKAMVLRTTFYNATWRTISGLVGMLFRKPPKVEVPPKVEPLLEDVDAAGQPFQLFLQDVSENSLTVGRVAVLVDYPTAPEGITQADAIRMNLRPTMQLYRTESVINWRTGRVNNQTVLTQVVLKEPEVVPDPSDEFASKEQDNYRVLDLEKPPAVGGVETKPVYRQRVFKPKSQSKAGGTVTYVADPPIYPKMNNAPLGYIPIVIMGTDDVGTDVDEPPLIDLVDLNLAHYRTSADYAHGCHFTALPTLFLAGFKAELDAAGNPKAVYIGSETAIVTSNPDAKADFVEFSGAGLSTIENKLNREEQQMAILGARMLEPQRAAPETAESASIHRKGEESTLSSMAQAISLGMTQALKWFTEWAGADPEKVLVELNRDFFPAPMDPGMLSALLTGWQQGAPGLSDQGLFDLLKAGEIVSDGVTLEEEQARIEARQQQIQEQQAAAMQLQQDLFAGQGEGGQGGAAPPAEKAPQPIIIQLPKGNGKRTVTGPNGQKYTIEEAA